MQCLVVPLKQKGPDSKTSSHMRFDRAAWLNEEERASSLSLSLPCSCPCPTSLSPPIPILACVRLWPSSLTTHSAILCYPSLSLSCTEGLLAFPPLPEIPDPRSTLDPCILCFKIISLDFLPFPNNQIRFPQSGGWNLSALQRGATPNWPNVASSVPRIPGAAITQACRGGLCVPVRCAVRGGERHVCTALALRLPPWRCTLLLSQLSKGQ